MNAILAALDKFAESQPEQVALIDERREISYRQLASEVVLLADWLSARDIRRLGLWGENATQWIVADLAAWRAGVTTIPLPRFFSAEQLRHVIASSGLDQLLVCGTIADAVPVTARQATPIADLYLDQLADGIDQPPKSVDDICKITYTSGTTGKPKGVCLSTAQLERVAGALATTIQSADSTHSLGRHFNLLPLSTLLENVAGVYVPLLLGRTIVSLAGESTGLLGSSHLELPKLLQALNRYRPNSLVVLPQILRGLVAAAESGAALPESLRFVAVGGAATPAGLLKRARTKGIPVYEGYGLSECASVVSLNAPGADRPGSVGRPLDHVSVRIVDGNIEVSGNVFSGYLGQPETGPEDGWFDTGDLGHFDAEGFLYLSGRRKNLLISSFGRNISPEWVEGELLDCDSIAQAMVYGDAQPFCAAIVVPMTGVDESAIASDLAALNRRLPDYARIRQWVIAERPFSTADQTLTDNGRLRREGIAARYRDAISALYANASANTTEGIFDEVF
jgi:long-subunit acyl-CoA synthetase (AMP-forming)